MDRILIVDDEASLLEFLEIMLAKEGYAVVTARTGAEALARIGQETFDLVITDVQMPEVSGLELLRRVKEVSPDTAVIMITAFASAETAVEAMKEGAYDYITKPFKVDEIKLVIKNALERRNLSRENLLLKKELKTKYNFSNIIGSSPEMLKIYNLIQRVAATRTNVLISGESGTGKELVAKAIHYNSPRKDKPFVTINCGAIPENLMESELFGHKKGSFTGAVANKMGLFEAAHEGTLFLDEIGELTPPIQVKLLRAIQERTFKPVGGTEDVTVDVRIICATNKDLEKEVAAGTFREDLFYRLNVIQINLPPLRERREDIPILAQHFLEKYAKELGKDIRKISAEAMALLQQYSYPGNVRELENIIERSVALESTNVILQESLPTFLTRRDETKGTFGVVPDIPAEGVNLEDLVGALERTLLLKALEKSNGVKKKAAKLLKISFRSMRYRLEKYGIDAKDDLAGPEL
ncbi:MAG TPA: sigma-54 dependent transcriptional regulator [Thermodesulfobacteriota bacterium]